MVSIRTRVRRLVRVNEGGRRIGEDHHRAKLTDADVEQIIAMLDAGMGYRRIAAKFDDIEGGISKTTIAKIARGEIRAQLCAKIKRCT